MPVRVKSLPQHKEADVVISPSDLLSELHIYIVPLHKWIPFRRLARNQVVDETVSAGFVRVDANLNLERLREQLKDQLPSDIPDHYVFIKSVGRNFTQVRTHQEKVLKVKNFLPPHAKDPELHILELSEELLRSYSSIPNLLLSDTELSDAPGYTSGLGFSSTGLSKESVDARGVVYLNDFDRQARSSLVDERLAMLHLDSSSGLPQGLPHHHELPKAPLAYFDGDDEDSGRASTPLVGFNASHSKTKQFSDDQRSNRTKSRSKNRTQKMAHETDDEDISIRSEFRKSRTGRTAGSKSRPENSKISQSSTVRRSASYESLLKHAEAARLPNPDERNSSQIQQRRRRSSSASSVAKRNLAGKGSLRASSRASKTKASSDAAQHYVPHIWTAERMARKSVQKLEKERLASTEVLKQAEAKKFELQLKKEEEFLRQSNINQPQKSDEMDTPLLKVNEDDLESNDISSQNSLPGVLHEERTKQKSHAKESKAQNQGNHQEKSLKNKVIGRVDLKNDPSLSKNFKETLRKASRDKEAKLKHRLARRNSINGSNREHILSDKELGIAKEKRDTIQKGLRKSSLPTSESSSTQIKSKISISKSSGNLSRQPHTKEVPRPSDKPPDTSLGTKANTKSSKNNRKIDLNLQKKDAKIDSKMKNLSDNKNDSRGKQNGSDKDLKDQNTESKLPNNQLENEEIESVDGINVRSRKFEKNKSRVRSNIDPLAKDPQSRAPLSREKIKRNLNETATPEEDKNNKLSISKNLLSNDGKVVGHLSGSKNEGFEITYDIEFENSDPTNIKLKNASRYTIDTQENDWHSRNSSEQTKEAMKKYKSEHSVRINDENSVPFSDLERPRNVAPRKRKFTMTSLPTYKKLEGHLKMIFQEKTKLEDERMRLFANARNLHEEVLSVREKKRLFWWDQYNIERQRGARLEERQAGLRNDLESQYTKAVGSILKKHPLATGIKDEPSRKASYKISAIRLKGEIADLIRRVEAIDIKLQAESRLRQQAEKEVRQLRSEVNRKKASVVLSQNRPPQRKASHLTFVSDDSFKIS